MIPLDPQKFGHFILYELPYWLQLALPTLFFRCRTMKVIVQIPCFNEEKTLPRTVADIPRHMTGVDQVEILVIDDGSSDATSRVARELGVEHLVRHRRNRGLAAAFRTGLDTALREGADIIVNTDGDNQYVGADIAKLVAPIVNGASDVVVGDRQILSVPYFSPTKKLLSRLGSAVVRILSGVEIPDAVSGFRAISRNAAQDINIVSSFSYTIEMLIQCGRKRLAIQSVPVRVNDKLRESRLFRSIPQFIAYSLTTLLRIYAMVRPLRFFMTIGAITTALGAGTIFRFLYYYHIGDGSGHVQSLIIGGSVLLIGVFTMLIGLLADLISFNRQLSEMALQRLKRIEGIVEGLEKR